MKEQVQVEVEVICKVTVAGKWVFYEHIKKPATPPKPKGEKKERKAGVAKGSTQHFPQVRRGEIGAGSFACVD